MHESIVHHHIRRSKRSQAPNGDQPGVAGAGSHQIHDTPRTMIAVRDRAHRGCGLPAGTGGRKMCGGVYLSSLPPGQNVSGAPVSPTAAFTGGVGTAIEPIPLDFIFCGLHFACQARSGTGPIGGGTPRLSSAVEGTIGTF